MKSATLFILSSSVVLLLFITTLAAAHGNGQNTNTQNTGDHTGGMGGDMSTDHMGSGNMGDHANMRYDHSGFGSMEDHMTINGSISVEATGITISISVNPSDDMRDMMDGDHMGMGNDRSMNMDDYTNMMNATLTKLVEFEDIDANGYSANDSVISEFNLNQTTLNEPVFNSTTGEYLITSKDSDLFTMIVVLNSDNNMPFAWKWSLILNYPFVSNTSDIAMLHEITTPKGPLTGMMNENSSEMGGNEHFGDRFMGDNNGNLPMFFSWDDYAVVDGVNENVTATTVGNTFALSVAQGSQIYYDPQVGVDPTAINEVNSMFEDLSQEGFMATVMSPTFIGLFVGIIGLSALAILTIFNKKK